MSQPKATAERDPIDILLVFTKLAPGGTTMHADDLAQGLAQRGLRCRLIFLYAEEAVELGFADVECLESAPPTGAAAYPRLLWRLYRRIAQLRPKIVHGAMPLAANLSPLAGWAAGARVRTIAQHIVAEDLRASQLFMERVNAVTGLAQKNVCVSHAVLESFQGLGRAHQDRATVIQNGVPAPKAQDSLIPASVLELRQSVDLLAYCAGALNERKNQRVLIDALAEAERVGLVLAGDGPDRRALVAQAERLNLSDRIVFLGHVDKPVAEALHHGCDLFALPSLREGLPLVLIEALFGSGCLVASDIAPNAEVLGLSVPPSPAGLLVAPRDAAAWGRILRRLRDDPGERAALAAAARARSTAFSADAMIAAYLEIWRNSGAVAPDKPLSPLAKA